MAQSNSTGGGSILMMYPVMQATGTETTIKIAPESSLPASLSAIIDDGYNSIKLALGVYSNEKDKVGIVSTAPSFDASPKSIAFTIDRDDLYTIRFLQRYCSGLRTGLEIPATQGQPNEKNYEDGLAINSTADEDTIIKLSDTIFFIWYGAPTGDAAGEKTMRKIVYGFAGISSSTPNFSTSYNTDTQFTFTLTGAPQSYKADIKANDLYTPNSVDVNGIGTGMGSSLLSNYPINDISDLFPAGYQFTLPKETSILQDVITALFN